MIYLTEYEYDTPHNLRELKFFPEISCCYDLIYSEERKTECYIYNDSEPKIIPTKYNIYQNSKNINREELEYLKLMENISKLPISQSRNSEVLSSFGERMIFDL